MLPPSARSFLGNRQALRRVAGRMGVTNRAIEASTTKCGKNPLTISLGTVCFSSNKPSFPSDLAKSCMESWKLSPGTKRLLSSTISVPSSSSPSHQSPGMFNNKWSLGVAAGSLLIAVLHSMTGSQDDFYDYRFKTSKSPDDLASFYGGEEFMELFCIFPFVGHIMMRNGEFDEKGNVRTTGLPGTMIVSMVFSDDTNQETGEAEWFNKRERFRNTLFGWTAWDMVSNFGFRTAEDGTIECYHYGEYFHGNLPVVSQLFLLIFKIHARWLAWSTEHHINHYAFTAQNEEEEEMEQESRKNMPLFLLKNYAWSDLMAMIFGRKEKLGNVKAKNGALLTDEQQTDVSSKDNTSFLVRRRSLADSDTEPSDETISTTRLPIQDHATKMRVSQDIATDRAAIKTILARSNTNSPRDVHAVLSRTYSIRNKEPAEEKSTMDASPSKSKTTMRRRGSIFESNDAAKNSAYSVATEAARVQHMTRRASLARHNSVRNQDQSEELEVEEDGNVPTDHVIANNEASASAAAAAVATTTTNTTKEQTTGIESDSGSKTHTSALEHDTFSAVQRRASEMGA